MRLGPDLVPYVVQYQASSMIRELTVRQRCKNYQKIYIQQYESFRDANGLAISEMNGL